MASSSLSRRRGELFGQHGISFSQYISTSTAMGTGSWNKRDKLYLNMIWFYDPNSSPVPPACLVFFSSNCTLIISVIIVLSWVWFVSAGLSCHFCPCTVHRCLCLSCVFLKGLYYYRLLSSLSPSFLWLLFCAQLLHFVHFSIHIWLLCDTSAGCQFLFAADKMKRYWARHIWEFSCTVHREGSLCSYNL